MTVNSFDRQHEIFSDRADSTLILAPLLCRNFVKCWMVLYTCSSHASRASVAWECYYHPVVSSQWAHISGCDHNTDFIALSVIHVLSEVREHQAILFCSILIALCAGCGHVRALEMCSRM